MKKVLLAMTMFFSMTQNSHAIISDATTNSDYCGESFTCLISSTLPTGWILAQDEMTLEQKNEFLRVEARNLIDGITSESVLLQKLADKDGKEVMDLAREILADK